MYCPYTDKELTFEKMSKEHIIPLSLGGSNEFCLQVDAKFNSKVGSSVDGDMANDFLVLFRRREADTRGHSNKRPVIKSKKSSMGDSEHPVQITLAGKDGVKVYDPIQCRELDESEITEQTFKSQFNVSMYGRLKFAAKVALSAGYFVFGEWFRENVSHDEIRMLMNFNPSLSKKEDFRDIKLKAYDEFTPTNERDNQQRAIDELFCSLSGGSCVLFIPGPQNIGIVIGILGKHVATLNVPANTENFPFLEENDLGHVVIIKAGKFERISYRRMAKLAHEALQNKEKG